MNSATAASTQEPMSANTQARPAIRNRPHERAGAVLRDPRRRPTTRPGDGDRIRLVAVDAATGPRTLHPVPGRPPRQPRCRPQLPSRSPVHHRRHGRRRRRSARRPRHPPHPSAGPVDGSMIGMEFALRHADRLDRLVLAGPGAAPARSAVDPISIWNWVKANDPSGEVFGAQQFTWLFSSAFLRNQQAVQETIALLASNPNPIEPRGLRPPGSGLPAVRRPRSARRHHGPDPGDRR